MKKLLQVILLSICFSSAWAQTFTTGYGSLVVFTDGHHDSPVGATEADCQRNRTRIINHYVAMILDEEGEVVAVDESRSTPCGPRTSSLPELDVAAWSALEIPVVCLSCPLIHPGSFEIYYPGFESEIKDLYYQHGIDQYNRELSELQEKFDLKGFEKAVYQLNNEIYLMKK